MTLQLLKPLFKPYRDILGWLPGQAASHARICPVRPWVYLLPLLMLSGLPLAGHTAPGDGGTPPGLALWLNAADLADQADGTPVGHWRNAAQGAGDAVATAERPAPLKSTDPRTGKPLVLFDGTGSRLSLPDLALPQDFTAFFALQIEPQVASPGPQDSVWRPLLLSRTDPFLMEGADGYAFTFSRPGEEAFSVCLNNGSKVERVETPVESFGRMELIVIRKKGPEVTFYRGGIRVTEAPLTRPDSLPLTTGYTLGGSAGNRFFRGALAELAIFVHALDDQGLDAWSEAMMTRWQIKPNRQPLDDPRWFGSGKLLARKGYYDQPYLAALRSGEWICIATTSAGSEGAADQHLVLMRSADHGKSWTPPMRAIEPLEPDGAKPLQPSWGCPWTGPDGRLFVFYNVASGDPVRPVNYRYRVSEDGGRSWSAAVDLPIRKTLLDEEWPRVISWGVSAPFLQDGSLYVSFTRLTASKERYGEGWLFRSPNAASEPDLSRHRWEMLPEGSRGIRGEGMGDVQEEHQLVPLDDGRLFCVFRTLEGYIGQTFSLDQGRTFAPPQQARGIDGRLIKQPLACPRLLRDGAGHLYLWTHENDARAVPMRNKDRDTVWLRAAHFRDGDCLWGPPEMLLYDFAPPFGSGMSYPDWLADDDGMVLTTTQKKEVRQFRVPADFLQVVREGAPVPPPDIEWERGKPVPGSRQEIDKQNGFTLEVRLSNPALEGHWITLRGGGGCSLSLAREGEDVVARVSDGEGRPVSCVFDAALLKADDPVVSLIVDLRARRVCAILSGLLDDGGARRAGGVGLLPPGFSFDSLSAPEMDTEPAIERIRLWHRPLLIAETIAAQAQSRP